MTVHTHGTITIQCVNKEERLNIRIAKPFEELIKSNNKVQNNLLLTLSPLSLKSYA
jgi:hypothetical protein